MTKNYVVPCKVSYTFGFVHKLFKCQQQRLRHHAKRYKFPKPESENYVNTQSLLLIIQKLFSKKVYITQNDLGFS